MKSHATPEQLTVDIKGCSVYATEDFVLVLEPGVKLSTLLGAISGAEVVDLTEKDEIEGHGV